MKMLQFLCSVSCRTDQTNITAQPGQDARLPCTSPDNKPALFVEWRRTDLRSEYVLRYRNNKINTENQHPSFRDRVDLLDQQMKDGDVSLVLRNVTTGDRGAYKCRVVQTDRKIDTVFTINLDVETSPGESLSAFSAASCLVMSEGISSES
uniref:Ig-like domain-containing protein n=1 Tax=Poecilia latipinna TaxID=48699 RepID=A0A3B3UWC6_9TELE